MAILRNTGPYLGSPLPDVDVGALTYRRVLKNAQADIAGARYLATDDTVTDHINHSGGPRGARMGIPWVCQTMDAGLSLDAGGAKNGGHVSGDIFEFHWLIIVPAGEDTIRVDVRLAGVGGVVNGEWTDLTRSYAPRCRLSSSTDVTTAAGDDLTVALSGTEAGGDFNGVAIFTGVAAGLALLTVQINTTPFDIVGHDVLTRVADIIVRPARNGVARLQPTRRSDDTVPVVAPGASEAHFHQVMDDESFASVGIPDPAISGWHTSRIDANENALEEWASGAPAGGNATYVQTEDALRNPTRDRFRAFTRKTFTDEPIPVIPILSACFGGIKDDGGYLVHPTTLASYTTRTGFAPFATSASSAELGSVLAQIPDVPSSPSVLRWAILVGQSSGVGFTNIRVAPSVGASAGASGVAPTALTGAGHLALATGTALAFSRDDDPDDCRLRVFGLNLAAHSELDYCILAAAMWVQE
jgi:hypothetical protein